VAVASAGPYANLHFAPNRLPRQHLTTQFLQAGCPSCHPTNSVKALKAVIKAVIFTYWLIIYQNSFHHSHFHCSLQARLLQLSLSHPAQVSDHPATTDPELSCTCCCQSSQIQSHHSHPPVSTLVKDNWAHWIQAPLTYLQSSHNHPTFTSA